METAPVEDYPYSYSLHPSEYRFPFAFTLAKLREKIAPFRFGLAAREIIRSLGLTGDEKILEIGSGLGLLGEQIKKRIGANTFYVGIDLAFNPLAKSKEKRILPVQANAIKLPFSNESFDVVISTDVLEHIPDAETAVKEIRRVLKLGGKAFIVIADPSEPRFEKVVDHIRRSPTDSDVSFWEELFEKNGFNILPESEKYRERDWRRRIFNLPFLVKLRDTPGFACAFNPVCRPGVYILQKPATV